MIDRKITSGERCNQMLNACNRVIHIDPREIERLAGMAHTVNGYGKKRPLAIRVQP